MQSTGVDPKFFAFSSREWRQISIASFCLAIVFSLPYWFTYWMTVNDFQFLGDFKNNHDRNSYFMWLSQVARGDVFLCNLFTSIPHPGGVFNLYLYLAGLPAYLFGFSLDLCSEIARFVSAILLSLATYGFVALFFQGKNRWLAWVAVLFTGGFGLFVEPLRHIWKNIDLWRVSSDIWIYESQPFSSLLYATLFPIALACLLATLRLCALAMLTKKIRYSIFAGCMVFVTSLIHPYDVGVIFGILGLATCWLVYLYRQEWKIWIRQASIIFLLGAPSFFYNYWILSQNPGLQVWREQNLNYSPCISTFLIGCGLPCFFSLCWCLAANIRNRVKFCVLVYVLFLGFLVLMENFFPWSRVYSVMQFASALIVLAMLKFSGLGRKDINWNSPVLFVIVWLVAAFLLLYSPVAFQRRFCVGISIPFAVLFMLWLQEHYGDRQWPSSKYVWVVGMWIAAASLFSLTRYVYEFSYPFKNHEKEAFSGFIPKEKIEAFSLLKKTGAYESVLASYETGNQIPRFTAMPVVLGSSQQTDHFKETKRFVEDFFSGKMATKEKRQFLHERHVAYIFYGPEERVLDVQNSFLEWARNNGWQPIVATTHTKYLVFYKLPSR